MKVYGPYTRKDGRKHIVKYHNGKRTTQSYPRYLMEQHLGRELLPHEEVDHKDDDVTNDVISNYQILTKQKNIEKHFSKPENKRKIGTYVCPICSETFSKYENNVKHNRVLGKAGPFCSRSCAGKYSVTVVP